MRVTDLARKVDMKTADLRERLPDFGVATDAKDIETELAHEIMAKLNSGETAASVADEDDEGPELMGMMFDDEEEEEPAVEEKDEESEEKEDSEDEESEEKDEEKPARVVAAGFNVGERRQKSSADQEAARDRWAAAKKASETGVEKKVQPAGLPQIQRLSGGSGRTKPVREPEVQRKPKKVQELVIDTSQPKREIALGDTISIREFGEKMGVSPVRIVMELLKNGVMTTVNASIDFDTAVIMSDTFWVEIVRDTTAVSGEDLLKGNIEKLLEDDEKNLVDRAPVIAVMGHVDHGKTTLLDAIRKANVASGESGGITQHIGAYQTTVKDRKITFLDTPGHEAFTAMRARGARATDIAVLVVAADDGVKPQTIEAINHAKDAGVPIVVAITKADKDGANLDRVKGELAEHGLQAADWGGETEMVPVAAPTSMGVDELLDIILLTNDLDPVKGNPNREAVGTIIESHLDKSLGPVATLLINTGTLRVGDDFIVGPHAGRIKKMLDHRGKAVKIAEPGDPVLIVGMGTLPERGIGEILQAFPDATSAKAKAEEFARLLDMKAKQKVTNLGQLLGQINTGKIKELKIVLKSDVEGSLEAIRASIEKIENPEVKPKIIHAGVGDVTETDVLMAAAAGGLLLAFHVDANPHVSKIADQEGVTIRRHKIIYKLLEEIEKMLGGMLEAEEVETDIGELEVKGIFLSKKKEMIIGGIVKEGYLEQGSAIRLYRGDEEYGIGRISSIQKGQDTAKKVEINHECGLKVELKGGIIVEEGDRIIAWKKETIEKTL